MLVGQNQRCRPKTHRASPTGFHGENFEGSARQTETYLGWNRDNVQLGLHERRSQILCADNYQARGRHKSEASQPQLETDIRALVDGLQL
jgi:hypothetical protein